MDIVVNILITVAFFAIIIFIHELGHFTVAKLSGVKINEFALGMGPTLLKKQIGETVYSIRVFPIGGFVSMEGEDAQSKDPRAFGSRKLWQRILIIIAGALMNLILGYVLIFGINAAQPVLFTNTVAKFEEKASSSQTGLRVGDTIQKINGRTIWVENDIVTQLLRDSDGKVDMVVDRKGQKVELPAVQFSYTEKGGQKSLIIDFKVNGKEKTFLGIASYSVKKTASVARLVWVSLVDLVTGKASLNDLAGPIGMTNVVGQAAKVGWSNLLMLLAFITINVGVFNLLPLPALDGGRLLFLVIEAIRGKPIPAKYEGYIHTAGFMAVILLMIVVT
ncbi:MAG: M50 family metallopeptidase, partial [Oscillospiraceae bacterium]